MCAGDDDSGPSTVPFFVPLIFRCTQKQCHRTKAGTLLYYAQGGLKMNWVSRTTMERWKSFHLYLYSSTRRLCESCVSLFDLGVFFLPFSFFSIASLKTNSPEFRFGHAIISEPKIPCNFVGRTLNFIYLINLFNANVLLVVVVSVYLFINCCWHAWIGGRWEDDNVYGVNTKHRTQKCT